MRDYPLATLIADIAGEMEVNLLSLLLAEGGSLGWLTGHVSKSHHLFAKNLGIKSVTAIFQSAYISPKWYVNGQRSGRNAPSWNYGAAQAQGSMRFNDVALWMREHLGALINAQESSRPEPWSPAQADLSSWRLRQRDSLVSKWAYRACVASAFCHNSVQLQTATVWWSILLTIVDLVRQRFLN